jgi:hypothetical protein
MKNWRTMTMMRRKKANKLKRMPKRKKKRVKKRQKRILKLKRAHKVRSMPSSGLSMARTSSSE